MGCPQPDQFVIRMNELIKTNQSHLNTKPMKSVNLIPMGILSVVLSACTHETDHLNTVTQDATYMKVLGITAGNATNPYDDVGQTYKDLLVSYKSGNYAPKDYGNMVNIVTILTGRPVSTALQGTLTTIINNPEVAANSV